MRDVVVTVDRDLAVATMLDRMADPAGEVFELWFRTTLALRRTGEGWRIVHEHASVPFTMDGTFRALTDLRP